MTDVTWGFWWKWQGLTETRAEAGSIDGGLVARDPTGDWALVVWLAPKCPPGQDTVDCPELGSVRDDEPSE